MKTNNKTHLQTERGKLMKKLITILTTLTLLFNLSTVSNAGITAAGSYPKTDTVEVVDLGDGITIEYEITETPSMARASTKTATKTATCKADGVKIATIKLTATFSYTGSSATCTSASATYTTYNGWRASNKSTTRSGNTATAKAKFSKGIRDHGYVTTTMSCSKTGVIS